MPINRCLEYEVDVEEARPRTGNINFTATKQASNTRMRTSLLKLTKQQIAFICKACYARVTVAELSGPGYKRIEWESLNEILQQITRQLDFLTSEHLPIPLISVKNPDPDSRQYTSEQWTNIPVTYLIMPKLHGEIPAFRGSQRVVAQPPKESLR